MAKTAAPKTDFDEEIDEQNMPEIAATGAEKDGDGVPYCVKHHCRMKQYNGGKAGSPVAYFKCLADGCDERAKKIKVVKSVPGEPLTCHRCASLTPQPVMEREASVSTLMYTILKCPCCGHKSAPLPRPEFVANHSQRRGARQVEELGAR